MILSRHLSELLSFKTPGPDILSLYLNLDDGRSATTALAALIKTLPEEIVANSADDWSAAGRAVVDFEAASERGLAVFSSKRFGLLRVCPLPEPTRSRAVFQSRPVLAPLLHIADRHLRYGLLVVDESSARFFEYYMGHLRELGEHKLTVSKKARAASLQAVAERAEQLYRQGNFQRLILAVPPELEKELTAILHRLLLDNLILDAGLGGIDPTEMRARIVTAESQARRLRETVMATHLLDRTGPRAAIGLRGALQAVEELSVKTLYLRDGFAKIGRRCLGCRRLSLNDSKCSRCSGATEIVFNLAEELAESALQQGAEVFRFLHQTPLDNVGSIGAELREPTAPPLKPKAEKANVLPRRSAKAPV